MKPLFFILFLQIILSISSLGQDKQVEKNPIDIKLEQCLDIDSNQTTYGMIGCISAASEEWDTELNKYYRLLKDQLDTESQEKLKLAQREWILYRDRELEFMSLFYDKMEGTMWKVVAADREMSIVRQRTLDLMSYYETITLGE